MDRATFKEDRKSIRNLMFLAAGILFLVMCVLFGIFYAVIGSGFIRESLKDFEVVTYLTLAAAVFAFGVSLINLLGARTNYTDCFRVRRGYSYEIRKRSILLYSPLFALIVLAVKSFYIASYMMEHKESTFKLLVFYFVAFVFYSVVIATMMTILMSVSKLTCIALYAIQPWIFNFFASIHRIPFIAGTWNIGKTAILCVIFAGVLVVLLKNLKRVCLISDYK